MSGRNEISQEYINMINKSLDGKPEYLRSYISFMSNSSVRTQYTYLKAVIQFMDWNGKEVEDLKFDDFTNYLSKIIYRDDGSKTTASYQIGVYAALKKFNTYLWAAKRLPDNYMLYINRPKAKDSQGTIAKRANGYLTEKEIKQYLDYIDKRWLYMSHTLGDEWVARDRAMLLTFLCTGIRVTALRSIDVDDIDLSKHILTVTEKGDKVRQFDIPIKLCDAIKKWLEYRKVIMKDNDSKALFVSRKRNRMSFEAIKNVTTKYAECIPNKRITPHKLRATFGTQLYNKTGDIYFVQGVMGHSNPQTTEVYIRDKKEDTKRSSDIMAKLI